MKFMYVVTFLISTLLANANVVELTEGMSYIKVQDKSGKKYKIERSQERGASLTNTFALTSRPSPPFFIEPFVVENGVETVGEMEVIDFLFMKKGLFIDARLKNW